MFLLYIKKTEKIKFLFAVTKLTLKFCDKNAMKNGLLKFYI
jgi:hypothetical protein